MVQISMDMPIGCIDCKFIVFEEKRINAYCYITKQTMENLTYKKPKLPSCPLVEVEDDTDDRR